MAGLMGLSYRETIFLGDKRTRGNCIAEYRFTRGINKKKNIFPQVFPELEGIGLRRGERFNRNLRGPFPRRGHWIYATTRRRKWLRQV